METCALRCQLVLIEKSPWIEEGAGSERSIQKGQTELFPRIFFKLIYTVTLTIMETPCTLTTMSNPNYNSDIMYRLKSRSKKSDNGCVLFTGNSAHIYGTVSITVDGVRKNVPAHRAMWMAHKNDFTIPTHTQICHECDTPRCINVDHLFVGNAKINCADKLAKDRNAKHYMLHTRQRKFTDEQIAAIKNATGKLKDIAGEHGVTTGYVSKIKNGKAKTLITQ